MNISPFKKLKIVIMKLSKLNEILKHGNLHDHIPHHRDNTIKMQGFFLKSNTLDFYSVSVIIYM